ncbi:scavenger receptor class F member 1-like [Saccostrea echinata]|uniref:scavenger receptor class F member 1-like n=1 Tax=Saccostrea echinata TaxID=191078 RepID=UPI002A8040C2|nr:scavenger receptor class F member 1-like [Saccostrea echinata]
MNITVNRVTQGIALYNSKNPPISTICKGYEPSFATIEICEVFVMECKDYKYGPNCVFDCGHCKNNTLCSKIDGTCENGCETEWSGSFCHKVSSANEHTGY